MSHNKPEVHNCKKNYKNLYEIVHILLSIPYKILNGTRVFKYHGVQCLNITQSLLGLSVQI